MDEIWNQDNEFHQYLAWIYIIKCYLEIFRPNLRESTDQSMDFKNEWRVQWERYCQIQCRLIKEDQVNNRTIENGINDVK